MCADALSDLARAVLALSVYMFFFYIQCDEDLESCDLPPIDTDDMISHAFLVIYRPDSQVGI